VHKVSAAFFGKASGITRFASERAPTRKDELAQEHDAGLAREGGFAAIRKTFCWEGAVYTEIGFESARCGLRLGAAQHLTHLHRKALRANTEGELVRREFINTTPATLWLPRNI
jgi:hypothetical protein